MNRCASPRVAWVIAIVWIPLLACGAPEQPERTASSPPVTAAVYDVAPLGRVLLARLDNFGMVDYAALKADPAELELYVAGLAALDPAAFESWTRAERIAFWINAYNGLTLQAIIDHYPIRSSVLRSVIYPKNSIRQIAGVWDKLQFDVMGRQLTLNQIEHEILRAEYGEARIHMALVCAAKGCPPLRWEPFAGDKLDAQLEDQTVRFLSNPERFRLEMDAGKIYLSSIFEWFGEDFIEFYGTDERYGSRSPGERAVLNFVAQHLEGPMREFVENDGFAIEYVDYDWTLNERNTG